MATGTEHRTVLYLCYGTGRHVDELRYSVLTATQAAYAGDHTVLVYTDDPEPFAPFDVEIRLLDEATLTAWLGDTTYHWRRKPMAIIDALERRPGRLLYVDGDTWFRRSPAVALDRIAPGRTAMHLAEGRLSETGTALDAACARLLERVRLSDRAGASYVVDPAMVMWNAGAIGLHSDDLGLMHEAVRMADQLWHADPTIETLEQLAVSHWLGTVPRRELDDVVFHYWPFHLREAFSPRLPALLDGVTRDNLVARTPALLAQRPQALAWSRARMGVRRALRRAGLPARGVLASG